jgi:hypothetical protein
MIHLYDEGGRKYRLVIAQFSVLFMCIVSTSNILAYYIWRYSLKFLHSSHVFFNHYHKKRFHVVVISMSFICVHAKFHISLCWFMPWNSLNIQTRLDQEVHWMIWVPVLSLICFRVLPSCTQTAVHMLLPVLQTFAEILWNQPRTACCVGNYVFSHVKSLPFHPVLEFGECLEVTLW